MSERKAMRLYNKILNKIQRKIGNGITDSEQLNKLGKKMFGKKYLGTFPYDLAPQKNGYCIVNLDDKTMSGSHWVGVIIKLPNMYIYDSFGRETMSILPNFKIAIPHDTDHDIEQSDTEENCGQRSMVSLKVYDKLGLKSYLLL